MQVIKMIGFISKLGDSYFVINNTLKVIAHNNVQKVLVEGMMNGEDALLQI